MMNMTSQTLRCRRSPTSSLVSRIPNPPPSIPFRREQRHEEGLSDGLFTAVRPS
jgi:hypothetical protein